MWEYQNTRISSQNDALHIFTLNSSREVFYEKRLEIVFYGHMLLMILTVKKLLDHFIKGI